MTDPGHLLPLEEPAPSLNDLLLPASPPMALGSQPIFPSSGVGEFVLALQSQDLETHTTNSQTKSSPVL